MSTIKQIGFCCAVALALASCTQARRQQAEAPAYFTQVTDSGFLYSHNWEAIPCFSVRLEGAEWEFQESLPARARWSRGDIVMSVYFSDNRQQRYAVDGMSPEQALRAFLAYELEFIRPNFEFQVTKPPKFAQVDESIWMQWGWTGTGGKLLGPTNQSPADQRHVLFSLWVDPWVMTFDWASSNMEALETPTLEMVEMLESLRFHPGCHRAMQPGSTR